MKLTFVERNVYWVIPISISSIVLIVLIILAPIFFYIQKWWAFWGVK